MVSALFSNKNQSVITFEHTYKTYRVCNENHSTLLLLIKEVCLKASLQSDDLEQIYLASNL